MWHRSVRSHFPVFTFDFRFLVCYTVDSKRNAGTKKQQITGGRAWKRHIYFWQTGFEEIEGLTVVDILRRAGAEMCRRFRLWDAKN